MALSYDQGELNFSEKTNLNQIYQSLLDAVYERGYERNRRHASIRGMAKRNFVRVLEEIALAAWHGDGRTTTIQEIQAHCDGSGLKELLAIFEEGAQAGVTRLLAAFYFRQGSSQRGGERTFEFTHKSFGEYLTACRIVRAIRRIHTMLERRKQDIDEGWDERHALIHWVKVCGGQSPMSQYLFKFVKDEVRLQAAQEVAQWQKTVTLLINSLMRQWMPMEHLPRTKFRSEAIQARYAETSLFAALNACARVTQTVSAVSWRHPQSFGALLGTLQGQRTSFENPLILDCLSYLNLKNSILIFRDLYKANLYRADLEGANLGGANLRGANLQEGKLLGANLLGANLRGANLYRANLQEANLRGANLGEANLRGTNLRGANLRGANLGGANLKEANLGGANLKGANLVGTTLVGTTLVGTTLVDANLGGANLVDVNLRGTNLGGANLKGANLKGACFEAINWDDKTIWENVRCLETAVNVPERLKQKLGLVH